MIVMRRDGMAQARARDFQSSMMPGRLSPGYLKRLSYPREGAMHTAVTFPWPMACTIVHGLGSIQLRGCAGQT